MDDRQNTLSVDYVERLYTDYLNDPGSVSTEWQEYFQTTIGGNGAATSSGYQPSFRPASIFNPPAGGNGAADQTQLRVARVQERVDQLIRNFRVRGHRMAKLDPLSEPGDPPPELTLDYYGFGEDDLDRIFSAGTLSPGDMLPLGEIVRKLLERPPQVIGFADAPSSRGGWGATVVQLCRSMR